MLTKTVFLIFLISYSDVLASNIRAIKTKSGDFTGLAYKGVEILQNSEENPMISVGNWFFACYRTPYYLHIRFVNQTIPQRM